MKKILKFLNNIILIFLICVLIFVCFSKYVIKNKVIKLGEYAILVVLTESMDPTIEKNEMILIKECPKYHEGDIVTYCDDENYLITHRIMEISKNKFVTKGDNNYISDEKINVKDIQGKVVYHSKKIGIFILYFLKPLIFIYIGILIIIYILKLSKEVNENEDKTE